MTDSFAPLRQKLAWEVPSERWYVPRDESFLQEIVTELSAGRERGVIWVTAPSGAGLSTQLARLGEELSGSGWRPVRISMLGRAEPGRAIGPTAMVMVTAFWLLRALPDGNHQLDNSAERAALRLVEALRVLSMLQAPRTRSDWVNSLGQALFVTIQRMKSPTFLEQIEAEPSMSFADWAEVVTGLTKVLSTGSKIVLIVDDVNELDLAGGADRLLPRVASLWQTLSVPVVMSYPRRLDYSKDFAYVTSREPRIALRPLPVSGRAEFHHEVFKRRMSRVALEPSVVAAADQLASGNTAEFLDLIANALRTAAARGEQPSLHHVDAVGKRRGEELRRLVVGGGALREFQALARDGSLEELAAPWLGVRAVVEDGDAATLRIHPGLATEIAAKETQD